MVLKSMPSCLSPVRVAMVPPIVTSKVHATSGSLNFQDQTLVLAGLAICSIEIMGISSYM